MDNDVWDDEDDTTDLPTSSNDKFEKDLDKLREIHSNVPPAADFNETDGCRRDIKRESSLDSRNPRRGGLMRDIGRGQKRLLKWARCWGR